MVGFFRAALQEIIPRKVFSDAVSWAEMLRKSLLLLSLAACCLTAADLPRGQIIDEVKCEKDAAESYALYLPSNYTADRAWPVLLAFDPRANGRSPVATYQAAAEKYGYIVAGSKNSRNGPYNIGISAAHAMYADVTARFHTNPRRIYATGHSGGSRLAMGLALQIDKGKFAGVIASSAAFPFPDPPDTLDFPVFGTAGTEDFNYVEMQRFDRQVQSPHKVRVFNGGHTWPTTELAMEAIEWLELQAMKTGLEKQEAQKIDTFFAAAKARAGAASGLESLYLWTGVATDFAGLRDVKEAAGRVQVLRTLPTVKSETDRKQSDERYELTVNSELAGLMEDMNGPDDRAPVRERIRSRLTDLQQRANMTGDSPERRMSRRIIRGLLLGAREVDDPELQQFFATLR